MNKKKHAPLDTILFTICISLLAVIRSFFFRDMVDQAGQLPRLLPSILYNTSMICIISGIITVGLMIFSKPDTKTEYRKDELAIRAYSKVIEKLWPSTVILYILCECFFSTILTVNPEWRRNMLLLMLPCFALGSDISLMANGCSIRNLRVRFWQVVVAFAIAGYFFFDMIMGKLEFI